MKKKEDINRWLRQQAYSPDTTRSYRWHLERLLRWLLLKRVDFDAMSEDDFLAFLDDQEWGDSMRRLSMCAARAYAKKSRGEDHSIFGVKIRRPSEKPQRTLSAEEVRRVLDVVNLDKPNGLRDHAIICLMVDTGLRSAELCGLQLNTIDLDKRLLNTRVKGGGWRYAAFTRYTELSIRSWLDIRSGYARVGNNHLFVGVRGHTPGEKLTNDGLRCIFRRLAKKADVAHFSPHALRRTMATLMTGDNQAPDRVTQISGGWKDPNMVRRYTLAMGIESVRPFLAMKAVNPEDYADSED